MGAIGKAVDGRLNRGHSSPEEAKAIEPHDLFDSRHYEAQRRHLTDARTLPAWCYTSEDFYRRERERIFLHAWQFVGRTDEIPSPGDYRCTETAGGPVSVSGQPITCGHFLAEENPAETLTALRRSWTRDLSRAAQTGPEC